MSFFEDLINPETAKQHIKQGTDQWDAMRVGRFTSSEMYKLMTEPKSAEAKKAGNLSEGALTYVQQKVAETLTGQLKQTSYAFPLVYGKENEEHGRNAFIEKFSYQWDEIGFVGFGDHAGGSPDGIINETDILEVKCPFAIDTHVAYLQLLDQWDLKREKPEYYWQCMSNLLFTKKDQCHFVSWDPRYPEGKQLAHIIVKPMADDLERIVNRIGKAVEEKLRTLKEING